MKTVSVKRLVFFFCTAGIVHLLSQFSSVTLSRYDANPSRVLGDYMFYSVYNIIVYNETAIKKQMFELVKVAKPL